MFLSYLLTLNNCYGLLNVGSLWVLQVLLTFMYVVRLTSESKLARGVANFSLSGWMYGLIDCVLALCSPLLPPSGLFYLTLGERWHAQWTGQRFCVSSILIIV